MVLRNIVQTLQAHAVSEGAGVTVHRTIGTPGLRSLDPFLMLDHFSSDDPDDYIAGFPDHPHRGFITFTYMIDGHMLHQDSMGNQGDLRSGGAQWMKAASGVIHSEMPQQANGLMRGFQLWINLPRKDKMSDPEYQEYPSEAFPIVKTDDATVKVLIGEYQGQRSPVNDPLTRVQYLDVSLSVNNRFEFALPASYQCFIYVFEGEAKTGNSTLHQHSISVFGNGDQIEIYSGDKGARFILVAGIPVNEPIVQYGPFVMNTQEEIQQAFIDYREGQLVRKKASFETA